MGYDVFKSKCAHNRVLSRLEQCPDCVQSARAKAVAKAGPQMVHNGSISEHWLGRLKREGIYDHGTDSVMLSGVSVPGWLYRRSRREHDERISKEARESYERKIMLRFAERHRGRSEPMAGCLCATCTNLAYWKWKSLDLTDDLQPEQPVYKREYLGHWCEPSGECCKPAPE